MNRQGTAGFAKQKTKRAGMMRTHVNLPDPIYSYVINIGDCTGMTKLEQVLDQLELDEEKDFIWWNGQEKLRLIIPDELEQTNFKFLDHRDESSTNLRESIKKQRVKSEASNGMSSTFHSNLNEFMKFKNEVIWPDTKVLLTYDKIYVFELKCHSTPVLQNDEKTYNKLDVVHVKDLQVFEYGDFEFL